LILILYQNKELKTKMANFRFFYNWNSFRYKQNVG
jgi:hypothetical protein